MLRRTVAAALILLASLAADWSGILNPVTNWLSAQRMEMAPRAPTGDVVIVDIDSESIAALGSWPWPRRVHGELIDRLRALGAAEIAIDFDFSAPQNPEDDAALEAALKRAGGSIILAAFAQNLTAAVDARPTYNMPLPRFAHNAWVASVNVRPDYDGQVRSFGYGLIVDGQIVPSVPALLGGGIGQAGQEFVIDFSIAGKKIDRISMIDVLRGTVAPSRIAGKKVIVGAQAIELRDFFSVPVAGTISGAAVQAIATETLLQGRALRPSSNTVTFAGLILLAIGALAIGRARWSLILGVLVATATLTELAAILIQSRFALVIDTVPWHLAIAIFGVIVLILEIDFRQLVQTMLRVRADNAQALLGQVVADSFAGLVIVDEGGMIRSASRTASELLGLKQGLAGAKAREVLPAELSAAVDTALAVPEFDRFIRRPSIGIMRRADGESRSFEYVATVSKVESELAEGESTPKVHRVVCLTFTDVTEQKAAEAQIARLARFDSLTDLPNRNQILESLEKVFTTADSEMRSSAIVTFDLDGFKNVNDTLGHHIGDLLLKAVAARATATLPAGALLARLGGDEFAAVFSRGRASEDATGFATRVVTAMSKPFQLAGHQVMIGASAGVALADARDKGAGDMLKRADVALYRAKSNGGSGIVVFERSMLSALVERQQLEIELWKAFERREFEVWYQPQVELPGGRYTGVEALLRWRHPERGLIGPNEFIPVSESIGLIVDLGRWVLETACAQVARWPGGIRLAVNVSSVQFARCEMAEVVAGALEKSGLPASRLDVEITESLFMQPTRRVHTTLNAVRAMGVGVALDDFGTGYSSLSYIQKFPITKIKLDKSFVAGLPANTGSASIVRAVAGLARDLEVHLNAEGVESGAQADFLASLGVDEGQGYLYGRAQPADEMGRVLASAAQVVRLRA